MRPSHSLMHKSNDEVTHSLASLNHRFSGSWYCTEAVILVAFFLSEPAALRIAYANNICPSAWQSGYGHHLSC
jgi:hypothetical protein